MASHAEQYFEGNGGNAQGFRLGYTGFYDFSFGYVKSDDLKTISLEAYKVIPYKGLNFRAGGGLGYSIADISDRKADNGISEVLGGSVEYTITPSWSIVGTAKGIFFVTNTHQTIYGSHLETLSNGDAAEVLDTYQINNSERVDQGIYTVGLRYSW